MRRVRFGLVVGVAAALVACASAQGRDQGLQPTSRTLGPFVYFEEGTDLLIAVGAQATRQRLDTAYFPIEFGIANKNHEKVITITREAFSVTVGDSKEIPAATAAEVIGGYRQLNADRVLFRSREFTATKFDRYAQPAVDSRFYPNSQRRSGVVQERVELGSGTYFQDVLYFRNPGFSLKGQVVSLLVRLKAGEDPHVVVFKLD